MDVLTAVDRDRIASDLRDRHKFWLDLVDPSDDEINRLGEQLGLHPIAVEDTREFGQRPKVDVYQDHVLLVFFTARLDEDGSVVPIEVHVYVANDFLITARRGQCSVLDDLRNDVEQVHEHPVYTILDTLTDAFYPVIEGLEERIDSLEADVLTRPRREQLSAIYRLLQEVRMIGRTASVQRDQFEAASDELAQLVELEDTGEYLRDIGDHLAQVAGELHRQSEDLSSLTSTYFNANADRLNAVATRLTVIGTLFVLWTLVTGFFGQNFQWLTNHVESGSDFAIFGVGSLVIPTVILLTVFWVKRRDWF
jgi:magnesium transporter